MTEVVQPDYPRGITFEQVWAALMEDRERQKEDRERQEKSNAEFDRRMEESQRIFNEKSAEINNWIGSLTNLFGDFTLGMVAPKLREKFTDFGFIFQKSSLNVEIGTKKNDIRLEIDILLENGEKAMLVEVKTKLTIDRIYKHIERLEKMRKHADLHGDKRIFMGAVVGFAITDEVRKNALDHGFYIIEPDGENFNITPPDGKPKEW